MGEAKVTFLPEGKSASVEPGNTLSAAARAAGAFVDTPCGGRGVCGKCRVQTEGELGPRTPAEDKALTPEDLADGWRLACQAVVRGPATVRVPVGILQILHTGVREEYPLGPNVRKLFVHLAEPSLADQRSDLARLREALGDGLVYGPEVAHDLGRVLRPAEFAVTSVQVGDRCLAVEPGDTTAASYGVAFDIGTTTVVGVLLDLVTGAEVAVAANLNGQAGFGADVVSRITHAMASPENLMELQQSVVATMNGVLEVLLRESGVARENVYEVVAVGNTTMSHLLLGIPPSSLALAPYVAVTSDPHSLPANQIGLEISPRGRLYVLPNIACFVGSDTVGVILATGLHEDERVRLAIDIGTNGEIVLGSRERLIACSTAAGPAFEGAEITFGMRATEGAIEKVWIEDDVRVKTIGNARARGICGSGLIDAVAEMLRVGLLDYTGRLISAEEAKKSLPEALCRRLIQTETGAAFVLAEAGKRAVYLSQRDVRKLQLAKGAISAGIRILLKELGVTYQEIAEVLLAGAFGSYVNPASARAIGLVPPFPLSKLISVGNAASVGARLALLSVEARREAERVAARVEHIELSCRPDFQEEFMTAMYFAPEGTVGVP